MLVRAARVVVTKGSHVAALVQALREEPPSTLTFPESASNRLEDPPLPGLLKPIVDPSPINIPSNGKVTTSDIQHPVNARLGDPLPLARTVY